MLFVKFIYQLDDFAHNLSELLNLMPFFLIIFKKNAVKILSY